MRFFKANSECDNRAYALACELNCPNASELYHKGFAHLFPSDEYADKLSDAMVISGIRPVRKGFDGDEKIYNNIKELFEENYGMMADVRQSILDAIDLLDYNVDNKEIVVQLEDMAVSSSKWLHVCDVWRKKAAEYYKDGKTYKFDIDFEDFCDFMK